MKVFFSLISLFVLCSCTTAPYQISDRPSYGVIDRFKSSFRSGDKIKLEIDQQTKALRIAKGPSDLFGAANTYEFNIGEAFSGHLTDIVSNIFINDTKKPLKLFVKIENCDFSYANTMVHILAWTEIDMTISVKYSLEEKYLKASTYKYHARIDIPFLERTYGTQKDRAAVLAIDQILEQFILNISKDMAELNKD